MAASEDLDQALEQRRQTRTNVQQIVPAVGDGWRWYDVLFKVQRFAYRVPRRLRVPRVAFRALSRLVNIGYAVHQHAEHTAWPRDDPMENLHVPSDEHVHNAGLWVVELFPPSEFANLAAMIRRNAWDEQRRWLLGHQSNEELLESSRITHGVEWWDLATITGLNEDGFFADAVREPVPHPFRTITLRAVHVGAGVTAVVAHFQFRQEAAADLDTVLRGPHEPRLLRERGHRPRPENRLFSAYRSTQEARAEQHNVARRWMRKRCAGFFASHGEPQLLLDLLLLDSASPFADTEPTRDTSETLRALGINDGFFFASESIPKLALSEPWRRMTPGMPARNTWTLWGNQDEAISAADRLDMYGGPNGAALAHAVGETIRGFLVKLSLSIFVDVAERIYGASRDEARVGHRQFTTKSLRALRARLLTLSLDLATVADDVKSHWSRKYVPEPEIDFDRVAAPWIDARDRSQGLPVIPPRNFNRQMRKEQLQRLRMLRKADSDYRDILTTVASLGSSIDASKLGRRALWASLASLAVAVVALLSASITRHSVAVDLWEFVAKLLH